MHLSTIPLTGLLALSLIELGCRAAPPPIEPLDFHLTEIIRAAASPETVGDSRAVSRDAMLALAFERNPTFEVFGANMAAAEAAIAQARAYPNPEAGAAIGWSEPRTGGPTAREYGIDLSQQLEWPVQRRNRRLAAEAGVHVATREREAFTVTLRAEVMRAFDTLLYHQRALTLAESNAQITEDLQSLITRRVEAGEAPEVDLVRARVDHLQARRAIQAERRGVETVRAALRALTGHHLPPVFEVVDDLDSPGMTTGLPASPGAALADHPVLLRLAALRQQRASEVRAERVAWYPQPEPGVFFEREDDSKVTGISLGMEIPLWNRNGGGIALAEARLREVEAEIRRISLEILRDIETARAAHESAREQIAIFEGGLLDDAQRALETQQFLYEQGETDLLQVLDARRLAQQTRAEHLRTLLDAALARAYLDEALGKGDDLP